MLLSDWVYLYLCGRMLAACLPACSLSLTLTDGAVLCSGMFLLYLQKTADKLIIKHDFASTRFHCIHTRLLDSGKLRSVGGADVALAQMSAEAAH